MKKITLRVMVATMVAALVIALAGTQPAAAGSKGSGGGIGGVLDYTTLNVTR